MAVLHVVIPVYNERRTLEPCLDRVLAVTLPGARSMIVHVVDDHSETDAWESARGIVERLADAGHAISITRHDVNRGKGAALQTGFDAILESDPADDDLVVIQDADLEYDPQDFVRLIEPIDAGRVGAVVGTRWKGRAEPLHGLKRRIHAWGNGALTLLSNVMTGYALSDMECCYKMLRVDVLRRLRPMLSEGRFGIEPQMIAGLARLREKLEEVPIAYDPRGLDEGKKIGWRDGVRAIMVIARERFQPLPAESRQ